MRLPGSILEERRPSVARYLGFAVLLTLVALSLAALSAYPWVASAPDVALVKVAFKHVAAFGEAPSKELSREELERLPRHMRPQSAERARRGVRRDTRLVVALDGQPLLERTYPPSGLRRDGPTFAYEEAEVRPGRYRLEALVTEVAHEGEPAEGRGRFDLAREVEIRPGQVLLIELTGEAGLTMR